ncbi:FixH family protein [Aquidulcibacter sp.]|jgi:nitrogen fixation protein FixH|uniref:FixH family protein n=1 Tax=Aquidulcibacter sp. TaxID=2052990 RepID=UPI000AF8BF43|nr:FixH family protein [Aquidulcibacter sp.]MCE2890114.1 FixH family protein [Hyphomonadaceae bacterium]MCZ8209339.1 FixH family protein [Aquidulcibacter sp.]
MTDLTVPSKPFRLTGWHVLAMFGGLFAVMLAVNILFVVLALKTFSGETDHAYISGLKFNETLAANARQAELGWTMTLGLERPTGGGAVLEARLTDRSQQPLTGARLQGTIGRTTDANEDQVLSFTETAPGIYRAVIHQIRPGRWKFSASAKLDGAPQFSTETTLSLR